MMRRIRAQMVVEVVSVSEIIKEQIMTQCPPQDPDIRVLPVVVLFCLSGPVLITFIHFVDSEQRADQWLQTV